MLKHLLYKRISLFLSCFCLLTFCAQSITSSYAQEDEEEVSTDVEFEEENLEDETSEQIEESSGTLSFFNLVPYAQFVEYVYAGDDYYFPSCHLIMEFTPDSNGIFQIAAMGTHSTSAHIYQLRAEGLYELAVYEDYTLVEDLRYAEASTSGQGTLIIPSELTIGMTYHAGPNNSNTYTLIDVLPQINIAKQTYYDVVKIKVERSDGNFYYYFAPNLGFIAAELIDANGETTTVYHLQRASGFINY